MTDTLGDRIRTKRQQMRVSSDTAQAAAQEWAKNYTDNVKTIVQNYIDNQITSARTYVDNQVTAAKNVSKNYVDNKINKLATDNNLINNP